MNNNLLVNRLSHFVPTTYQIDNHYDSLSNVVSVALFRTNIAMTPEEITEHIFTDMGIKVHLTQIEESIQDLVDKKIVSVAIDKYILNQSEKSNIENAIENEQNLEESVLKSWINSLRDKYQIMAKKNLMI
ncbi:hypothetical protein [Fusibacter bizertensis]